MSTLDDSTSPQSMKIHLKNNARLLETGMFADFYFLSNDGRRFSVHRVVIAAQSRFFETLFGHCTGNEFSFDELNSEELESLLKFIYMARTPRKVHRSKMLIAGDKYTISGLVDACSAKVLESDIPSEAIQLLLDAFLINSDELKEKAFELVSRNYDSVRQSEDWILLDARHLEGLCDHEMRKRTNQLFRL